MDSYLNLVDLTVYTNKTNFNGVLGLVEQVSDNLFLPDGVYSLWSLDTANPEQTGKYPGSNMYGTHPFIMGQAPDNTWFGMFYNVAAA